MSSKNFECIEHIVPGQHIRQYARGTSVCQEDELQLAVKQYRPRYGTNPRAGDITILACHASGFPKELYEPLWDEIFLHTTTRKTFKIRNIWIADIANQGASGVLNKQKLGSEPSYFDHARDLLLMCNRFREEMPRPIVGVGHSLGGCVIINLAILHPRLLTTVIAIEPIINKTAQEMNFKGAYPITFKNDTWASRQDAEKALGTNPLYRRFDPSVLALLLKHGLRDVSTGETTQVTTKDQEAFSFARAAYPQPGTSLSVFQPTRAEYLDLDIANRNVENAFYNPSATQTHHLLPQLRPSCLYVAGEKTHMFSSSKQGLADKMAVTGTAVGGSGGHAEGKVQKHVIPAASHFVPFEDPSKVAQIAANWLEKEWDSWCQEEQVELAAIQNIPLEARARIDDDWKWWMNHLYGKKKPHSETRNGGGSSSKAKL